MFTNKWKLFTNKWFIALVFAWMHREEKIEMKIVYKWTLYIQKNELRNNAYKVSK